MEKASMFELIRRWWHKDYPLCKDCIYCKRGDGDPKCTLQTVTEWDYVFPPKIFYQNCRIARIAWCGELGKYFSKKN